MEAMVTGDLVEQWTDMFDLLDRTGEGTLSRVDFCMLLRSLLDVSERDVETLIDSVDPDETGSLTKDNLLSIMRSRWPGDPPVSGDQLTAALAAFDKDGDGLVSIVELRLALLSHGESLSEDEVAALLADAEVTDSGHIRYESLVQLLVAGATESVKPPPGSKNSTLDVTAVASAAGRLAGVWPPGGLPPAAAAVPNHSRHAAAKTPGASGSLHSGSSAAASPVVATPRITAPASKAVSAGAPVPAGATPALHAAASAFAMSSAAITAVSTAAAPTTTTTTTNNASSNAPPVPANNLQPPVTATATAAPVIDVSQPQSTVPTTVTASSPAKPTRASSGLPPSPASKPSPGKPMPGPKPVPKPSSVASTSQAAWEAQAGGRL